MASSSSSPQKSKDSDDDDHAGTSGEPDQDKLECAVCLQTCVQPVQLPCMHIFCYLCVKGVTHQSKRCAMCRQEIPSNYLDNPHLISVEQSNVVFEGSYQWFYEGKNGWWQYDERTSTEIEAAYKAGDKQCEVLIAGFLYVIDFENNMQYRRCDPFRRRKIKRDLISAPKKGVAGIRLPSQTPQCDDATSSLQSLHLSDSSNGDDACCSKNSTSDVSGDGDGVSSVCSPKRGCRGNRVRGKRNRRNATKAANSPSTSHQQPVVTVTDCRQNATRAANLPSARQQQPVVAVTDSNTGNHTSTYTPKSEARVIHQSVKTATATAVAAAVNPPNAAGQRQPAGSVAVVTPGPPTCIVAAPAPQVCMVYQPVISTTAGLAVSSIATSAPLPTVLSGSGRPVTTSIVPVSATNIICLPPTVYQVTKPVIVKIAVGGTAAGGLAVPTSSTGGVRSQVLTKPQTPETKPRIPADNQSKPQGLTSAATSSSAKIPVPEIKREFGLRKRRSTPKVEAGSPSKRIRKTVKTEGSNP